MSRGHIEHVKEDGYGNNFGYLNDIKSLKAFDAQRTINDFFQWAAFFSGQVGKIKKTKQSFCFRIISFFKNPPHLPLLRRGDFYVLLARVHLSMIPRKSPEINPHTVKNLTRLSFYFQGIEPLRAIDKKTIICYIYK